MASLSTHLSIAPPFSPGFFGGRLLQADAGGDVAVRPELGKVERLPDRPRDLEFQRTAPTYDLCCDVDHFSSQGAWIGCERDDVLADILLEGFVEEERNAHEVVERGVGAKPLEGKPLIGKLLEDTEGQLAPAAVVVASDDPFGREHGLEAGLTELLIHAVAHAEVGVEDRTGPGKGEQELIVFGHRPGEKRSAEPLPGFPAVSELHVFPNTAVFDLLGSKVAPPCLLGDFSDRIGDIGVELSAADVSHIAGLHGLEEFLIHVAAVEVKNDGNILAVAAADQVHHASDHPLGPMAVIAVLVPGAEHRIDDKALPGHLEGTESQVLFVGGHHALSLVSVVVVHAHEIDIEQDDRGPADLEPPHKELEQDPATHPNQRPGEGLTESLDRMGRSHMARRGLDSGRIARILLQGVEVAQVATGAVEEETENLLEEVISGDPFAVFTKTAEKGHKEHWYHLDLINIMDKKSHASPAGDPFICWLDLGNFQLAFVPLAGGFTHGIPHFLGESF